MLGGCDTPEAGRIPCRTNRTPLGGGRDRRAIDVPADPRLDPSIRLVARRLDGDLARVHPSFRFEERLAAEQDSPAATLALALTESNRTIAVSYATEAGHFQRAGLPTIVCGPGSIEQAHVADEFLAVAQLEACLEFLRRLARRESA